MSALESGDVKKIENIHRRRIHGLSIRREILDGRPCIKRLLKGNREVAELLISKGADVNARDPQRILTLTYFCLQQRCSVQ
ncbi:MAG: hypothetical protein AB2L14_36705 [Candidatus Xenobiia bacterium LiM19]